MNMIEVKTAELSGPALDWAVAMTGAVTVEQNGLDLDARGRPTVGGDMKIPYEPSNNWGQCGPLIEKYNIQTSYNGNGFHRSPTGKYWCAYVCEPHGPEMRPSGGGPTPLIAACRAIVAAKLGDTVQVPAELLP